MDAQAVQRVREVYDASYRRLVGQLTGVTGDPVEAGEVVMTAFGKAVRSARELGWLGDPEDWLRTVAVDVARTRRRRRRWLRGSHPPSTLSGTTYADLGLERLDLLARLRRTTPAQQEAADARSLADLADAVAVRTEQPPFDEVVARVRGDRRRARRRVSVVAAGLAVAALVVLPQRGGDSAGEKPARPDPSLPMPDTGLAIGVAEVLARSEVSIVALAGSDDGGIAALWAGCGTGGTGCGYVVLTGDGETLGSVVVDSSVLSPSVGGWLVHTAGGWRELTSDGEVSGVTTAGEDGVRSGDEVVQTAGGLGLLRGDRLLLMPTASGSPTQAYVTPQGRLLEVTATGDGSERLRASTDGRHWTTLRSWGAGTGVTQVRLAGRGRTVATVATGLGPSGELTVEQVEVSHDAGRSWTPARGIDFADEVRDPSGLAVSFHGTVFMTTGSDGLIRIDAEGNAARTPVGVGDRDVFATTYEVCALTTPRRAGRPDQVACSDDDGLSWTRKPVPGGSLVRRG